MRIRPPIVVSALACGALVTGAPAAAPAPVDPRAGGLEIVMGEWTLVSEARAIRPGTVTFVVTNRGKFAHGFRIRSDRRDDDDGDDRSGGHIGHGGDRDRFEARTRVLRPGESTRMTVDLATGVYEIDCYVEDARGEHDALGMQGTLEVRADAPLVTPPAKKPPAARNFVAIRGFAYKPATINVKPGAAVRWRNDDTAPHTVSAVNGSFTSKNLGKGGVYIRKFSRAGTFAYLCAIHPAMRARVVVR